MQIRKLPWLSSKYYNITISPIPAPSRIVSFLPLPFTSWLHEKPALGWGVQGLSKVSNKWPWPSKARQEISLSGEKMLSDSGFGFRKQINCNYTKYLEAASFSRVSTGVVLHSQVSKEMWGYKVIIFHPVVFGVVGYACPTSIPFCFSLWCWWNRKTRLFPQMETSPL